MFSDADGPKEPTPKPEPCDGEPKPLDPSLSDPRSHLFRDREFTLSYLCENPKPEVEKARSAKGKELAASGAGDGGNRGWVERDFLRMSGSKRDAAAAAEPLSEARGGDKRSRSDTLNLSLSPPNLSLSLNSTNPQPPPPVNPQAPPPAAPVAAPSVEPSSIPPMGQNLPVRAARTYSNSAAARSINSDDYGAASLSYSYSVPFSHNPSCSLTWNSMENYDLHAGEGTNGSVHSRFNFRPNGDGSVAFVNPAGFPHMPASGANNKELSNGFSRVNGLDSMSFLPSELPARAVRVNGSGSMDNSRNSVLSRPDRILKEIVSESILVVAQILRELPKESIDSLRDSVCALVETPQRKDELTSLQRKLARRSDLTPDSLSKAHEVQLEILVAVKTGMPHFVSGRNRIPSAMLVDMFLLLRCRNPNCKNLVPVDDCECKICSTKKGFCSACMCPVCQTFDCALNTCSWVGCDACEHWCHASCGLERKLIRPGPTLKGPMGTTEMQFQCLGCDHVSEMFGFVKDVFNMCAKQWTHSTLMKELDYVRRIFSASEDFEGKGLHAKAEEILNMLTKKQISPSDATNAMLDFFKYGVTEFSVTGSKKKGLFAGQASQTSEMLSLPASATGSAMNNSFNFKPSTSMLDPQIDGLKLTTPKPPLSVESRPKDEECQSLETIIRCKDAEAKLYQKLADDARREVESYRQVIRAKTEKLEEEYAEKLAKLCFQEAEEKRRKKLEEFKLVKTAHNDYHMMKMRMQAEITSLLERMESTKKMWV